MTDAGFRFHIGTPLPDLRQIASWMLTHAAKNDGWQTGACIVETARPRRFEMAGLLANLEPNDIGQGRGWPSSISFNEENRSWSCLRLLRNW